MITINPSNNKTHVQEDSTQDFNIDSPAPNSSYTWKVEGSNTVDPDVLPYGECRVNWNEEGKYKLYVYENLDIFGNYDDMGSIEIIIHSEPNPMIAGNTNPAVNIRHRYGTPFREDATYDWQVNGGQIINESANIIEVEWDDTSSGKSIEIYEWNNVWGPVYSSKSVNVKSGPSNFSGYQSNLIEERKDKKNAKLSYYQKREDKDQKEIELKNLERTHAIDSQEYLNTQDELDQLKTETEFKRLQYQFLQEDANRLYQDFVDINDHTALVANLDDDCPILFFPVDIETKFKKEGGNYNLFVRIYPDDVVIQNHEAPITKREKEAGENYWAQVNQSGVGEEDKINAWRAIATKLSSERAAWVVKQTNPDLGNDPVIKNTSWSQPSVAKVLPDKFVITIYYDTDDTDTTDYNKLGEIETKKVNDELKIGFDPKDKLSLDRDTSGDLILGDDINWLEEFDDAVNQGMAAKIDLTSDFSTELTNQEIENYQFKIIVTGVKISSDKERGKELLEELIDDHHYSNDGFGLLKLGSSTKNSGRSDSSFSSINVDHEKTYQIEQGDPLFNPVDMNDFKNKKDGQVLADALGIDYSKLQHVENGGNNDIKRTLDMNNTIFEDTVPNSMILAISPFGPLYYEGYPEEKKDIKEFFSKHVGGRGLLPSIRVDDQPYGILPATTFSEWEWETDQTEIKRKIFENMSSIDYAIDPVVGEIPTVMGNNVGGMTDEDKQEQFAQTVSREPISNNFGHTFALGDEQVWNTLSFYNRPQDAKNWHNDLIDNANYVMNALNLNFSEIPKVLKLSYLPYQGELTIPIVQEAALSHTKPVVPLKGSQENYLGWLAKSTYEEIVNNDFSSVDADPDAEVPESLFFRVAKRAVILEYWNAAMKLRENYGEEELKPEDWIPPEFANITEEIPEKYTEGAQTANVVNVNNNIQTEDGRNVTTQEGINIVAVTSSEGGGDVVAENGNNVLTQNSSVNVIFDSSGSVVTQDGRNVITDGSGNIVTEDGEAIVTEIGSPLICEAQGSSNIVRNSGTNNIETDNGKNVKTTGGINVISVTTPNGVNVAAENGDNVLTQNTLVNVAVNTSTGSVRTNDGRNVVTDGAGNVITDDGEVIVTDSGAPLVYETGSGITEADIITDGNTISDTMEMVIPALSTEPVHQYIDETLASGDIEENSEVRELASSKWSVGDLAIEDSYTLREDFHATIDIFSSYRQDAWQLGIINRRLSLMRDSIHGRKTGIYLGAFGWVEGLKVNTDREMISSSEAEGITEDMETFSDGGGHIHAPSINHANTAAVLKSVYDENQNNQEEDFPHINLSSQRARTALKFIQGINKGQELGALLGYEFERGLKENYSLDLVQYIYAIRNKYSISEQVTPQNGATEDIKARDVIDGWTLYNKKSDGYPYGIDPANLPDESSQEGSAIKKEMEQLADHVDAINDLMLAESTYQLLQNNQEVAGSIMEALSNGKKVSSDFDVLKTPRSGKNLTQRFALHVNTGTQANQGWNIDMTERANAEINLNNWLAAKIGDPGKIVCRIDFSANTDDDASEEISDSVNFYLNQLNLHPIDLIYIIPDEFGNDGSEFTNRIVHKVKTEQNLPFDATIDIYFDSYIENSSLPGGDIITFDEILPLIKYLQTVITGNRFLKPSDFVLPEEGIPSNAGSNTGFDENELFNRVTTAHTNLKNTRDNLSTFISEYNTGTGFYEDTTRENNIDALRDSLLKASEFGVQGSIPHQYVNEYSDDALENLIKQAKNVKKGLDQRIEVVTESLNEYTSSQTHEETEKNVEHLFNTAKEVFGKAFTILPLFEFYNYNEITNAFNNSDNMLPSNKPFIAEEVIQGLAKVRQNIEDLEMTNSLSEVIGNFSDNNVPIQIPFEANDYWNAIEQPENHQIDKDKMSLIMQIPASNYNISDFQAGLFIDEWVENIPSQHETTGVTYNYNEPDAQAPNSLILGVTPKLTGNWEWSEVIGLLEESFKMAKKRAIDPDLLKDTELNSIMNRYVEIQRFENQELGYYQT